MIPAAMDRVLARPEVQQLLTAEQERVLIRAAQAGDLDARHRLIEANLRLVAKYAHGYQRATSGIPLEDLFAAGVLGLDVAVTRFNLGRRIRFASFAVYRIRRAIVDFIRDEWPLIHLPGWVHDNLPRLAAARADYLRKHGVEPANDELADLMGLPLPDLVRLVNGFNGFASLDQPLLNDGDHGDTWLEQLEYVDQPAVVDQLVARDLHRLVHAALANLLPDDAAWLAERWGIYSGDEARDAEIARRRGVTRAGAGLRLQRIAARTRKLARTSAPVRALADYAAA